MGDASGHAKCSTCGRVLPPDHTGPCPVPDCDGTNKTVVMQLTDEIRVSDSITTRTRREFFERRPKILALGIGADLAVTVVGAVAGGLFVGMAIAVIGGLLGYWLLPPTHARIVKIIERE